MSGQWTATSYSSNSTSVAVDESLNKDEVVILLQGKNIYKDKVFCYVKLTLRKLIDMKESMLKGENFLPSDFGTVLAAGQGEPSPELRSEMAVTHQMVDRPKQAEPPKPKKPKLGSFTARFAPED